MNILYITSVFPSPQKRMGGCFITRRLQHIRNFGSFTILAVYYRPIGAARFLRGLVGRLSPSLPSEYETSGITYKYYPIDVSIIEDFTGNKLKRFVIDHMVSILSGKNFDIIHAHYVYPAGVVGVCLKNRMEIPLVTTTHGSDINVDVNKRSHIKTSTLEALTKSDRTIFVSNALKNVAINIGFNGKHSSVIPNGVDCNRFRPLNKIESKTRLRINGLCVGFVGNLLPIKRAEKLPEIFEKIVEQVDAGFMVVGDGPQRDMIEAKCKKRGLRVIFYGSVPIDEVPRYINAMDVMILPSRNEGWPCVVLEAQACGLPVVGSDNGGTSEAIGDGGIVVKEGEDFEERFATAVINLLRNPIDPQKLREKALKYDWSEIVKKEIEIYRQLIEESKK